MICPGVSVGLIITKFPSLAFWQKIAESKLDEKKIKTINQNFNWE
jgi:hypothetical protein